MAFNLDEFAEKYKIHSETESFLKARIDEGVKPYHEGTVDDAREALLGAAEVFGGTGDYQGLEQNFLVPSIYNKGLGMQGLGASVSVTYGVPVTAYRAKTCDMVVAPPVVVYFHGGSDVIGSRKTHAAVCKILSRESPCVVVNVEYRLAPDHMFPANHDDAKCVVRWVAMNKSLVGGVNNSVVGVCGDGAGGRLAATVSHELSSSIQFAVLVYPNVNFAANYKSLDEFGNMPVMSKSSINWFTEQYITEKDYTNPRASPLLYKDFSSAPPTLMIVADLAPHRDGCYAYYEKLKQAGVKAQILTIKGVPEGFWMFPGAFKDCCRRAHEKAAKFMKSHS